MEKGEQARVWLYTRDLDAMATSMPVSASASGNTASGTTVMGQVVKHWGIVFDYLTEDDEDEVDCSIIYEANNENGLLQAKKRNFRKKLFATEWENKPGFYKEDMGKFRTVDEERAEHDERGGRQEGPRQGPGTGERGGGETS